MTKLKVTVSEKGILADSKWYYHPLVMLRSGETVTLIISKDNKTAKVFSENGEEWEQKAILAEEI